MPYSMRHRVGSHQKPLAAGPALERPFGGSKPISAGRPKSMILLRIVLASILILVIGAPTFSDQASTAYKRGVSAESQTQYDAAFEAYGEAHKLKPKDPQYLIAYLRVRAIAAAEHVRKG